MKKYLLAIGFFLVAGSLVVSSTSLKQLIISREIQQDLSLRIDTDKLVYSQGELVHISLTVINPKSHDFQLNMTGNSTYFISIVGPYDCPTYEQNFWDVWGEFMIPAYGETTVVENLTWNQTWSCDGRQAEPSEYTIYGRIFYWDGIQSVLEGKITIVIL